MSLKYPVGNRKLLKGRQQQSDSKCVVKIFILFVGFEKGNGETSFYSYSGELKLVVMGIEKCGWS